MKFIGIALLGSALVAPMAAQAGGLFDPAPEPVVMAPVTPVRPDADWSGFYGGLSLGYGDVGSDGDVLDGDGVIGGVLAGYRWDFGQFVMGVEGDYDITDITLGDTLGEEGDLGSVGRLKVQAGADLGRALVFATAGAAYGSASVGRTDLEDWGYFGGIGMDYAVNDRMTVGGEVLLHRFDDFDDSGIDLDATTAKARVAFRF